MYELYIGNVSVCDEACYEADEGGYGVESDYRVYVWNEGDEGMVFRDIMMKFLRLMIKIVDGVLLVFYEGEWW